MTPAHPQAASAPAPVTASPTRRIRITTPHILALSLVIQLGLLLYANHIDSHPERYGGLRYTDVDWRVVSDGARLIVNPSTGNLASGWLVERLGLRIGDPYERATFRYTPLLALFVAPSLLHPLLGRILLVLTSLLIPPLLLSLPASSRPSFWSTHLIWTLNPFVLNITTRGSPEPLVCLLVVLLLVSLRKSRECQAAVWLGLAVSWKIYPAVYVPALWSALARRHGWLGWGVWRFGLVAAATVGVVNGALWSIWGQPFIDHTFLYHLTRLDHRHNFSPYFYPVYLSLYPSGSGSPSVLSASTSAILRHPLTSFLPQLSMVLLAGFGLEPVTGLEFAMFVQTAAFVVFNKVCTSQYFMWFLPLLPPLLPHLAFTRRKALTLILGWVAGQALWLAYAYQLELMARDVYLPLWGAGLGLFAISIWVLGELVDGFVPPIHGKAE